MTRSAPHINASRAGAACRGFTLIEALVALVVLAFGMLAIAGFQLNLSRGSDIAKQRTEATRLAQQKMEELRSFGRIVAGGGTGYADLQSSVSPHETFGPASVPPYPSNTTYTRSWTVLPVLPGSALDPQRTVSVTVAWTDRAGDNDQVILSSVISKSNPADVGSLRAQPVGGGILRRASGGASVVPIRGTSVGSDDSGYSKVRVVDAARSLDITLVFNEGGETFNCGAVSPTDPSQVAACPKVMLLIGYVSAAQGATLPAAAQLNVKFVDGTRPDGTPPDGVAVAADVGGAPTCFVVDSVDQNTPAGSPTPIAGFLTYGCLLTPAAHAVPTPPATEPPGGLHWSARVELFGAAAVQVCRFGYDPAPTDTTVANARHPPTYLYVDHSLGNQNYVVIPIGGACADTPDALDHQATLPAS